MASDDFHPELASGALTLVPLILITSAVSAGILRRWSARLRDFENRDPQSPGRRFGALAYALVVGCLMGGAAIAAIVLSLYELKTRSNRWDGGIFWCSLAVTAGLGVAILRNIVFALVVGDFPVGDIDPPPPPTERRRLGSGDR